MQLVYRLFSAALVIFSHCFTLCFSDFDSNRIKLKTEEDAILWAGCRWPYDFEPNTVKKDEFTKNEALVNGLKRVEKIAKDGADITHKQILAAYYFTEGKYQDALYWASESAKKGASKGMYILYKGYAKGLGVIQDLEESAKWLFLAVARGNEDAIKALDDLQKDNSFNSAEWVKRGREKAQEWVKEHPSFFFVPC